MKNVIIISKSAADVIFQMLARYLGRNYGYEVPPIFYWYRNVVEAIKVIDDSDVAEGNHQDLLENSLGIVNYSAIYVENQMVIIITDFKFNTATIWSYIRRSRLAVRGVNLSRRPLFNSPSSQPINSSNIGKGIVWTQYADGSIRLTWKIHRTPLKNQFDKIERRFYRYKDGEYAIGIKDGIRYKLFANDTVEQINENKHPILRLTEEQFKSFLTECIKKIIIEIA